MPYSQLLGRAFDVVRREPALWILGMILALFGGGSSSPNVNMNYQMGDRDFNWEGTPPHIPDWLTVETVVPIIATVVGVIVLLMIIGLVVQSLVLAGLIHGADRAATGEDVRWGALLRAGWSRRGRRILGMKVVMAIPAFAGFAVGVAGFLVAALPIINTVLRGGEPSEGILATFIGGFLIFIPIVLLLVVAGLVLNLIGNYAAREIVLDDRPVMASFRSGWRLLRNNVAATIVFAILLAVIGIIAGLAIGFVILFVALLMGVPMFLLLNSWGFPMIQTVALVVILGLTLAIVGSILFGPVLAYVETAWTLAWRHLTGDAPATTGEVAV
jgi:hypothetical protein